MWGCEWWRLYKTTSTIKQQIREHFPCRRSLAAEQLLEEIKEAKLLGNVQCDIEVPENLRANFANFSPVFKNTVVRKSDIEDLMKIYAEDERFNLENRWYPASHYKMDHLLLLYWYFIYNWVSLAQKYTGLLSTLQTNASTGLCSQQWTQEGKVTKIQIQVSSQKQWSF